MRSGTQRRDNRVILVAMVLVGIGCNKTAAQSGDRSRRYAMLEAGSSPGGCAARWRRTARNHPRRRARMTFAFRKLPNADQTSG